jgi:hypothetical protein
MSEQPQEKIVIDDADVEGHLLGPDTYDAKPQGGKPHDLGVER